MRPARTILIMQLSNSRDEDVQGHESNVLTTNRHNVIFPSLTVEKKNECHNP